MVSKGGLQPEIISKDQFKLLMVNSFNVKDALLLENLFYTFDKEESGILDIRDIISNIVFWLKGPVNFKFALYFESHCYKEDKAVDCLKLLRFLAEVTEIYERSFSHTKTVPDKMNLKKDGKITYEEFEEYL